MFGSCHALLSLSLLAPLLILKTCVVMPPGSDDFEFWGVGAFGGVGGVGGWVNVVLLPSADGRANG